MLRAIVVDDEFETREGLRDYIPWTELGIGSVKTAADGPEAIGLACAATPDVVISDIRMPGMNGIEFAERLKAIAPSCRIIFISGYSDKDYLMSAIRLNVVSYVEKPLNLQEMISAIREAVLSLTKEKKLPSEIRKNSLLQSKLAWRLAETGEDAGSAEQSLREVNPAFLSCDRYCTFIIRTVAQDLPDSWPSPDIEDAVAGLCSAHLSAVVDGIGHIMHVCDPSLTKDGEVLNVAQMLMEMILRGSAGTGCFIAAGSCSVGLENIHRSYREALKASSRYFFTGASAVVVYSDELKEPASFDEGTVSAFEIYLRRGDRSCVAAVLDGFSAAVRAYRGADSGKVRSHFFKLLLRVEAVRSELGISGVSDAELRRELLWKTISEKQTFTEVQAYLDEEVQAFFSGLSNAQGKKVIPDIVKYIQIHYTDKALTVNGIAEKMNFTPAHLCHIFKKETGVTVNQYITSFRVDKAKALLKTQKIKLAELASLVGYGDANYFTRTFKKTVGVTPSEYREKCDRQETLTR